MGMFATKYIPFELTIVYTCRPRYGDARPRFIADYKNQFNKIETGKVQVPRGFMHLQIMHLASFMHLQIAQLVGFMHLLIAVSSGFMHLQNLIAQSAGFVHLQII